MLNESSIQGREIDGGLFHKFTYHFCVFLSDIRRIIARQSLIIRELNDLVWMFSIVEFIVSAFPNFVEFCFMSCICCSLLKNRMKSILWKLWNELNVSIALIITTIVKQRACKCIQLLNLI